MEDVREYKTKRNSKERKFVKDIASFFEKESGVTFDMDTDYRMGSNPEEEVLYDWDGTAIDDLQKEGV
ncbi:MAG: hypothetical protein K6G62_04735 [Eubacterium sp.]|nr:hypothetical protein [Eubacterium sp.]